MELCKDAEVTRKANGLRHAFCTYHFAANANENQTAQQAGNSPAMIHAHYKGLATESGGEKMVQSFTAEVRQECDSVVRHKKLLTPADECETKICFPKGDMAGSFAGATHGTCAAFKSQFDHLHWLKAE